MSQSKRAGAKKRRAKDHRAKDYDVFISYKRLNGEVCAIVEDRLRKEGFEVFTDQRLQGGKDWQQQLRARINECSVTIGLWSAEVEADPTEVEFELIHAYGIERLLGVRLDSSVPPSKLGKDNWLDFSGWNNPDLCEVQLARIVEEVRRMGATQSYDLVSRSPAAAAIDVHLGEIPPAPPKLIGREDEMAMLENAWQGGVVNTVVLHALGGAGKSALLRTFVDERLENGGDGADRIYGWSAYSQGSGTQKRADADGFISQALKDFGFQGEPPRDAVERARELARLVQQQRVLLLLDGLEPLQDPPGVNKGRLKDKGLKELIQKLSYSNPGLLIITTRQPITELENSGAVVTNHALDKLTPTSGADLLVELGVSGRQKHLEEAVKQVDGHALSVTLLGTYLTQVCGGDVRKRDLFDFRIRLTDEERALADLDPTLIPAKRAQKVMRGYLEQFDRLDETKGGGGPERALLHLLGLFDRPADGDAVDVLLAERIPGLTDDLFVEVEKTKGFLGFGRKVLTRELSAGEREARINWAKNRLRKLRLLSPKADEDPSGLDAHPVVRAYFADRLKDTAPEAAKAAHEKLYYHYSTIGLPPAFQCRIGIGLLSLSQKFDQEQFSQILSALASGSFPEHLKTSLPQVLQQTSVDELVSFLRSTQDTEFAAAQRAFLPDQLEEMQPLFHAVAHGVASGHVQEVFDEVFWMRLLRGNDKFLWQNIGAFGPELAILAQFYELPWSKPNADLSFNAKAFVLSEASFALTSLGRPRESVEPRQAGIKMRIASEDWSNASRAASALSDTLLNIGQVEDALTTARQALAHAQKADIRDEIPLRITDVAAAEIAAGDLESALKSFQRAEEISVSIDPDFPNLVSLQGYQYGDLLLSLGQSDEALRRGEYILGIAKRFVGKGLALYDFGFAYLLLARAQHYKGLSEAGHSYNEAVDGLRKAGLEDEIPKALLARAAWRRDQAAAGDASMINKALEDLHEVEEIAGDEMGLYLVDLALERARLALDVPAAFEDPNSVARDNTADAARRIAETGYHRRDGELAALQERLKSLPA